MRVFSNLAISLDGRIADWRHPERALGTPLDRRTMQIIRAQSDVIVVGSSTLAVRGEPIRIRDAKLRRGRLPPANVVVSGSGKLDPKWDFWKAADVRRFVFTTDQGLRAAREAAQGRAMVISCGESRVSLGRLLGRLKAEGYRHVLVEGGGKLMGEFVAQNLLQELYVTHTPWILGGPGNPELIANSAPLEKWRKLKLLKMRRIKDEMYAHYRIIGAKTV